MEAVVRQAMNIQVMEAEYMEIDSSGKPVEGLKHLVDVIYNLGKISSKEVNELLVSGCFLQGHKRQQ